MQRYSRSKYVVLLYSPNYFPQSRCSLFRSFALTLGCGYYYVGSWLCVLTMIPFFISFIRSFLFHSLSLSASLWFFSNSFGHSSNRLKNWIGHEIVCLPRCFNWIIIVCVCVCSKPKWQKFKFILGHNFSRSTNIHNCECANHGMKLHSIYNNYRIWDRQCAYKNDGGYSIADTFFLLALLQSSYYNLNWFCCCVHLCCHKCILTGREFSSAYNNNRAFGSAVRSSRRAGVAIRCCQSA